MGFKAKTKVPVGARPKRRLTATQVIGHLISKTGHPSAVFYNGAARCRLIDAETIRAALEALRKRRSLPLDVRALVGAVDPKAQDAATEHAWQLAIDGIRTLFHASPVGTARERALLLDVARNGTLVAALRLAARGESVLDPTWMAVLFAEGSRASLAMTKASAPGYVEYPDLLRDLEGFRGALEATGAAGTAGTAIVGSSGSGRGSARAQSTGTMTRARFWSVIDRASRASDHVEALRELLETLTPRKVEAFDRHFRSVLARAYSYDLWGAAYLMLGGCSDDGFVDFRAALIARGRVVFERVLKQPDSLADDLGDIEGEEAFAHVAGEVFRDKAGRKLHASGGSEPKRPTGKRWDFDDQDEMRRRYPRLYSRHGRST